MCNAEQFRGVRILVDEFGVDRVHKELVETGFVDPHSNMLTVGMQPFNVFARIASGEMSQPSMADAQVPLGHFRDRFVVACNKPECDENWSNNSPAWVGKASMSARHVMLLLKDLHWEWFNVLTFGKISGLDKGIHMLEEMQDAALTWVKGMKGWPPTDRVGLFLQCHGAGASVRSFHLHILDLDNLGPTYHNLKHKNLSLDTALEVLREEREEEELQSANSPDDIHPVPRSSIRDSENAAMELQKLQK